MTQIEMLFALIRMRDAAMDQVSYCEERIAQLKADMAHRAAPLSREPTGSHKKVPA